MKNFGFGVSEKDIFWQTPFSKDSYEQFNFKNALKDSEYSKRMYEVSSGFSVPDFSYVVEPTEGIWLMAIDGNTYLPKNNNGNPNDENNFHGASIGYNNVLTNKKHLFSWVEKVVNEAKKYNKTLIAFTHYPILDFNDNANSEIKQLLGNDKWQMDRVPNDEVAELFAEIVVGKTVLFPRAQDSLLSIQKALKPDTKVVDLPIYETVIEENIDRTYAEVLIFTSPSNVDAYFVDNLLEPGQKVIAIGNSTAKRFDEMGVSYILPYAPDEIGLAEAVFGIDL